MSLKFMAIMPADKESLIADKSVNITREKHEQVQEISNKTGYRIKEVVDMLLEYAIENIEWEERK